MSVVLMCLGKVGQRFGFRRERMHAREMNVCEGRMVAKESTCLKG